MIRARKAMPQNAVSKSTISLMLVSLLLAVGCVTVKKNNLDEILNVHEQGFTDAVNASDESREFVRELMQTIADLEYEVELQQ